MDGSRRVEAEVPVGMWFGRGFGRGFGVWFGRILGPVGLCFVLMCSWVIVLDWLVLALVLV